MTLSEMFAKRLDPADADEARDEASPLVRAAERKPITRS